MADIPCICTSYRRVTRRITAFYDRKLAPSGLTVTMFSVLRNAAAQQQATISALSRLLELERSTLGRNLKVLERKGLIALPTGTDGRTRNVEVTTSGRAALEQALHYWREAQKEMIGMLPRDVDSLRVELEQIRP